MTNLAYFFIALIIMIIVLIIDAFSHQQKNKKLSIVIHIIGLPVLLISMIVLAYLEFNLSLFIVPGAILIIIGLVFFRAGLAEIGENLRIAKKVYSKGIYSRVRHPIYSGLILACLGLALVVYSVLFFVYVVVLILMLVIIALYEEKHLIKRFGKAYLNYKKETGMFIPLK